MIEIKNKDFIDYESSVYFQFFGENTLMTQKHSHDFWELFFVIEGSVVHNFMDSRVCLNSGNAVIICPGDVHTLETTGEQSRFLNFTMTDDLMRQICNYLECDIKLFKTHKTKVDIASQLKKFEELKNRLQSLNTMQADSYNQKASLRLIAAEFILLIVQQIGITDSIRQMPQWFRTLIREMDKPENIEIGITAAAEKKGYSARMVNKNLQQFYNTSAKEFTTLSRLNYAGNLLRNTDLDIMSISLEVGYNSVSHFVRIFKDHYGMTPSDYRKHR